ncbi:MAG: hypothetical protein ACFFBC_03960 [Promethearchaeota archaeon]
MEEYEERSGKYAIWRGEITDGFKKWIKNPNSIPDLPSHVKRERQFRRETDKFAKQYGVPIDDYKIWIREKYPELIHKYPIIEENVSFRGESFRVENGGLNLNNMGIEDIDEIRGLNNLKELYFLNLSKNNIKEIKGLSNLKKLIILDLSNNNIHEIKGLETQKRLKKLYLNKNCIEEIEGLENLINLVDLWLDDNKIMVIKNLENLKMLELLILNKNKIKKIRGIKELSNLFSLEIDYNEISNIEDLSIFPPNMKTLKIYHNPLPKERYREIIKNFNIP